MSFHFIQPCSSVRANNVPAGDGWLHEVKFDGYRVQAQKVGSRVLIYSRNGHDFTERFPSIAQLLQELPAKAAVLDGEIVANDADGLPNFARLQVRWTRPYTIHLCAISVCSLWRNARRACRPCWSASIAQPSHCPNHSKTAWRCCE